MTVVVTGAAGFIGRAVTQRFLSAGIRVRGVDVQPMPAWWDTRAAEYVQGDVRDARVAIEAVQGSAAVVHLAADSGIPRSIAEPYLTADVNVLGTVRMLDACRQAQVGVFALASSCATLTVRRSGRMSPYAASKLCGEAYCQAFRETYGLRASVLRLSNVYGPGSLDKSSVVASLIRRGLTEGRLYVTGDGRQERDFVHVADVAEAFYLAVAGGHAGEYVIASGEVRAVRQVAEEVAAHLGLGHDAIVHGPAVPGEARTVDLDPGPTRESLGWQARISFAQGLADTVSWFREALGMPAS